MQGDAGEVEGAEGILSWWHLFGVAVYIGEFFASREGIFVYFWLAEDGKVGDACIS